MLLLKDSFNISKSSTVGDSPQIKRLFDDKLQAQRGKRFCSAAQQNEEQPSSPAHSQNIIKKLPSLSEQQQKLRKYIWGHEYAVPEK